MKEKDELGGISLKQLWERSIGIYPIDIFLHVYNNTFTHTPMRQLEIWTLNIWWYLGIID